MEAGGFSLCWIRGGEELGYRRAAVGRGRNGGSRAPRRLLRGRRLDLHELVVWGRAGLVEKRRGRVVDAGGLGRGGRKGIGAWGRRTEEVGGGW